MGKKDKPEQSAEIGAAESLGKAEYTEQLAALELQLDGLARWLQHSGKRLLVIIEGRDTAGKGGVINAISRPLNPRMCRVVALPKPTEREAGQWYFQRHVAHLPAAGELVLFDRSWYNRAGVEAVMGYCSPEQTAAFLKAAPVFEKMLVDDGLLLAKYWLTVDQAQQEKRFAERLADPLKRWKLSPIDVQARSRYDDYTAARERMLKATHTPHAPWTLVDFNDQKRGRLALIRNLMGRLPEHEVPVPTVELPPLPGPALKERFGVLKPI
jgi:polyphosphate kinase